MSINFLHELFELSFNLGHFFLNSWQVEGEGNERSEVCGQLLSQVEGKPEELDTHRQAEGDEEEDGCKAKANCFLAIHLLFPNSEVQEERQEEVSGLAHPSQVVVSTYKAIVLDPLQTKLVLVLRTAETREVEEALTEVIVRINDTCYAEHYHQCKGQEE